MGDHDTNAERSQGLREPEKVARFFKALGAVFNELGNSAEEMHAFRPHFPRMLDIRNLTQTYKRR